ncbi:Fibrinogen C domain-containing protein 1 [Branchiostoma belcheri]|nr:Fibrinogen C domain-containing protein 1 [Branchiostoma belcheri]
MASHFSCLLTLLVTSVFLCSAQSVCRPPSDEKCVCNVNCGNDNALQAELKELKIAMKQLSQTGKSNGTAADKPKDCQDILDNDETTPSGVYMVYPRDNLGGFNVFCDMDTDGGGWTLFQRRQDGTVDFYRGWTDYKTGFPFNLNGEFWLGNDNLYRLAVQKVYQLRVDMWDMQGNTAYAAYDTFAISPESQNYKLHIGTYSGTAGDSLSFHRGQQFSTKERDNDDSPTSSCAQDYKGAWWYEGCYQSNLNGLYQLRTSAGVIWYHWKGYNSLKRTEMKIRPAP